MCRSVSKTLWCASSLVTISGSLQICRFVAQTRACAFLCLHWWFVTSSAKAQCRSHLKALPALCFLFVLSGPSYCLVLHVWIWIGRLNWFKEKYFFAGQSAQLMRSSPLGCASGRGGNIPVGIADFCFACDAVSHDQLFCNLWVEIKENVVNINLIG